CGARAGESPTSGHAMDAVLHDGARVDAPLADEDRLVDPRVALVAGLQPQAGAEVMLVVVAGALSADCREGGRGVLDDAGVLHVDVRAVVRVQRGAHVEPPEAVW